LQRTSKAPTSQTSSLDNSRSIGIAVGQRAAQDTSNVRIEGRRSSLQERRPRALAEQLPPWRRQRPALQPSRAPHDPGGDSSPGAQGLHSRNREPEEVTTPIRRVMVTRAAGPLPGDAERNGGPAVIRRADAASRPHGERQAWTRPRSPSPRRGRHVVICIEARMYNRDARSASGWPWQCVIPPPVHLPGSPATVRSGGTAAGLAADEGVRGRASSVLATILIQ
jgi:hypothetical protein